MNTDRSTGRIVPMESVSLRLYSHAYMCGTGKHPNINVKTYSIGTTGRNTIDYSILIVLHVCLNQLMWLFPMESGSLLCGTGNHPNIDVETQIPLELLI